MKIINIFKEGLPHGEIGAGFLPWLPRLNLTYNPSEKASIDEAFIDFTRPVRLTILERYPYLAQVPSDAPDGIDSPLPPPPPVSWADLGAVVPITLASEASENNGESSTNVDGSTNEGEVGEGDGFTTWHDVALSIAAEMMEKIRDEVRTKLGYTTSAVRWPCVHSICCGLLI